jgi:hypothetical protein
MSWNVHRRFRSDMFLLHVGLMPEDSAVQNYFVWRRGFGICMRCAVGSEGFWRVLTMLRVTQHRWVPGRCPLSDILKLENSQSLKTAPSKGPNRVDASLPSPEEGNRSSFRNVVVSSGLSLWSWLQIDRLGFDSWHYQKKSNGSRTGSTQPREYNWGATW